MANYGILIADDLNGGFYLLAVNRGTTTASFTGGTSLLTDTVTQSGGVTTAISGTKDTTNMTGVSSSDDFRRVVPNPLTCAWKAGELCQNDRAFNG